MDRSKGEEVERKISQISSHGTTRSTVFRRTKRGTERLILFRPVPSHVPNGTTYLSSHLLHQKDGGKTSKEASQANKNSVEDLSTILKANHCLIHFCNITLLVTYKEAIDQDQDFNGIESGIKVKRRIRPRLRAKSVATKNNLKPPHRSLSSSSNTFLTQLAKMKTVQSFVLLFFFTICHNVTTGVYSQCLKDQQLSLLHLEENLTFDDDGDDSIGYSPTVVLGSVLLAVPTGMLLVLTLAANTSRVALIHLQSLNLVDNSFVEGSRIPSAIGKLTNLRYLNLSNNDYFGKIPFEISRLTRLEVLDISQSYNNGGRKPLESPKFSMLFQNLTELTELHLDGVDVSAEETHWCQAITSLLPNLKVLSLSNTNLSGPIDQSLAKLHSLSMIQLGEFFSNFSNLTVLNLDRNNISAPVPGFFANFSKLTTLSLAGCGLRGTFLKQIFQVPTLQTIDLSCNMELHGSLPEFPKNGSLRSLILSQTSFSGLLHDSICNLNMMSTLDLSKSNFTGSIPKSIGNLTKLVDLDVSSNMFNGPISSIDWENLINLVHLHLDSNQLVGSIPSSLFSLPLLPDLVLSHNNFSGQLPEIFNVSSSLVTFIDLSFNNLEGPVPVSIFNFRGLQTLTLSSNNFSAFPFNGPHQLPNLTEIDLSHNSLLVLYNGSNSSYSSFPQITDFSLVSNKLRTFPVFLRNQTYLTKLDLSENQIQGQLPNWIWKLDSLDFLNVSYNALENLEGPFINSTSPVSMLDLHSNQLKGPISIVPPYAEYLDYSNNHFSSSIPVSICNASGLLALDLSSNSLSGEIPQCLVAMRRLIILNVRKNNITGMISNLEFPENCECRSLIFLNLEVNQITDTFPCLLKNISTLIVLALRSNNFYGGIGCPVVKTNATCPILQILDLAYNNFNGEVLGFSLTTWQAMKDNTNIGFPSTVISYEPAITITSKGLKRDLAKILTILTLIDFSCNNFSGPIPKEMGDLKSLYFLNLSSNVFTGEIPSSFGNMRQLESLDLSENKLSGQIPQQLAKLNFLAFLNLSNNQLVGKIPAVAFGSLVFFKRWSKWYYRTMYKILVKIFPQLEEGIDPHRRHVHINQSNGSWPTLQIIDLAHNNLSGEMPRRSLTTWLAMRADDSLAKEEAELQTPIIIGKLPSSFGNMHQLESLDLSQNKISGQILSLLAKLSFHEFLNLSNNQFVCRIPSSTQISTFPKASFTGNKGLGGLLCLLTRKKDCHRHHNQTEAIRIPVTRLMWKDFKVKVTHKSSGAVTICNFQSQSKLETDK
ncbi:hypothetical protein DVH24_014807 [Malus domestica]|uniref:Leucine-rich repeat-containing N-terminal plant-type domain-containing protein n=1 Tax=Malus domestica TaxID=3750 RepID=A0A498K2B8_MALDO|nr:hypothetical protein DVH24_014807 [Malus domestica]